MCTARTFLCLLLATTATPAGIAVPPVKWNDVLKQPEAWYATAEARAIADSVLQYQRACGGWPKDIDMTAPPASAPASDARPDCTIDNGATTTQIRFLARVHRGPKDARYLAAAQRGVDYLLRAQYASGGWPQFYPLRTDYSRHITFNDNAMVNVMTLLDDLAAGRDALTFADERLRARARAAVEKGVDVMLRSQIKVNGTLTAWCAQHDEVTLEPRPARSYEHPSLSGNESVGIVRLLMRRDPSADSRLRPAIDAAVAWLTAVKLPSGQWARFYEIGTNRPIFSGRDGVIRYRLEEIEEERRNGYAWLGAWPRALLEEEYPRWLTRRGMFAAIPDSTSWQ